MQNIFIQLALLISPIVIGMVSARLFTPKIYKQCGEKSKLQPPGWVFAVVWSILYIMIGVAAMLAFQKLGRFSASLNMLIFTTVLLFAWWIIFANICSPYISFLFIYFIFGVLTATVVSFFKERLWVSGGLLIPLCLWLVFASILI